MFVSIFSRSVLIATAASSIALNLLLVPANSSAQQAGKLPEGVVAIVNGRPIASALIDEVELQLDSEQKPSSRQDILDELINLEVLTQRAEIEKLDSTTRVAASLQLQYAQTMANAYLEQLNDSIQLSDEVVRAEYDKQINLLENNEYQASHILLDSEAEAIDVIAALNVGGDFVQLAKEFSTGPSANNGGDLGWFDADTMVPEFSAAVAQLKKNEFTQQPVQTQFGWHVIILNDIRRGTAPNFDAVKAGIRNLMIRNKINQALADLVKQADIQRE